ncbi:MAG: hypothetical protein ACFFCW_47625, partial [Candidatus Hodarchaeota archaeon]
EDATFSLKTKCKTEPCKGGCKKVILDSVEGEVIIPVLYNNRVWGNPWNRKTYVNCDTGKVVHKSSPNTVRVTPSSTFAHEMTHVEQAKRYIEYDLSSGVNLKYESKCLSSSEVEAELSTCESKTTDIANARAGVAIHYLLTAYSFFSSGNHDYFSNPFEVEARANECVKMGSSVGEWGNFNETEIAPDYLELYK